MLRRVVTYVIKNETVRGGEPLKQIAAVPRAPLNSLLTRKRPSNRLS